MNVGQGGNIWLGSDIVRGQNRVLGKSNIMYDDGLDKLLN